MTPSRYLLTALLLGGALLPPVSAQDAEERVITREHVAGQVHVIRGDGGNVGAMVGDEGIFLVDTGYQVPEQVWVSLREVSGAPVKFAVNGHRHGDHFGGNRLAGEEGALIISHDDVRDVVAAGGRSGTPPPASAVPSITLGTGDRITIHFNGEQIDVIGAAPAHTADNLIVYFHGSNVLHMGDIFRPESWPNTRGGTFAGFVETCATAVAIGNDDTRVIPGHARVSTRQELIDFCAAHQAVFAEVSEMVAQGMTREQIVEANVTAPYEPVNGDPSGYLTALLDELTAGP